MEFLATMLLVAGMLSAVATFNHRHPARHRVGETVGEIRTCLEAERARTFLPLRGW